MTAIFDGWLDRPEPGFAPIDLPFLAHDRTFLAGAPDDRRVQARYFRDPRDGTIQAKVLFGRLTQGPPGHVHGGAMAAVMDEAMGGAAWLEGHPVVAAQLNLSYLQLLPVERPCLAVARLDQVQGRKVHAAGFLGSPDQQTIYCRATGLFIVLEAAHLDRLPPAAAEIVQRLRRPDQG